MLYVTGNCSPFTDVTFSLPTSGESVFARCLSSLQTERVSASNELKGPASTKYTGDKKEFIEHIRKVMLRKKVKVKSAYKPHGSSGRCLLYLRFV